MDIDQAKTKMGSAVEHLQEEIKKMRTGRAQASILDAVEVEVYGAMTPLKHIANIHVPDAQTLQVQPFDPNNLDAISTAIREDSSLGLSPADDGKVIRLPMPPMTTERRQDVVKQLHAEAEKTQVAVRNVRHDFLNDSKKRKNNGDISEEEHVHNDKDMQKLLEEVKADIVKIVKAKEEEILTV